MVATDRGTTGKTLENVIVLRQPEAEKNRQRTSSMIIRERLAGHNREEDRETKERS